MQESLLCGYAFHREVKMQGELAYGFTAYIMTQSLERTAHKNLKHLRYHCYELK